MRSEKYYYVYIVTNKYNTVLYVGMTNDLERRINEHKEKVYQGFTSKYNINKLVFFEQTTEVMSAIEREKQIKRWSHRKKRSLVTLNNPKWKDLSRELFD